MANDNASCCGQHGRYEDSFFCPRCANGEPARRIVSDDQKRDNPGVNRPRRDPLVAPCRAEWGSAW